MWTWKTAQIWDLSAAISLCFVICCWQRTLWVLGPGFSLLFTPSSSDGPICRICHEGGSGESLLSPCDCTGTLGTVHKSCLEKWLSSSNTSYCELCHTEFVVERRPRPLTEVGAAEPDSGQKKRGEGTPAGQNWETAVSSSKQKNINNSICK